MNCFGSTLVRLPAFHEVMSLQRPAWYHGSHKLPVETLVRENIVESKLNSSISSCVSSTQRRYSSNDFVQPCSVACLVPRLSKCLLHHCNLFLAESMMSSSSSSILS